ncbi:MAG: hypothetical protein ACI4WX_00065, partial [Aristaeellaceae bacterium]
VCINVQEEFANLLRNYHETLCQFVWIWANDAMLCANFIPRSRMRQTIPGFCIQKEKRRTHVRSVVLAAHMSPYTLFDSMIRA